MSGLPDVRRARRVLALLVPGVVVLLFMLIVPRALEPNGPNLDTLTDGSLTDAQAQTLDMVKELNAYLVSMVTLMFGGLGWYLSQYRSGSELFLRGVFFSTVGFLALAYWYAGRVYAEMAAELAQQSARRPAGRQSDLVLAGARVCRVRHRRRPGAAGFCGRGNPHEKVRSVYGDSTHSEP